MAIPDFQTVMLPLLNYFADQQTRVLRNCVEAMAAEFHLTDEERNELLPSGTQRRFDNRIGWALTHLKKAGLLSWPTNGRYQITERGLKVLADPPQRITLSYLDQFPEFQEFRRGQTKVAIPSETVANQVETPEEMLQGSYQKLRQALATELLQTVKECSPDFFERLVVDLLVKMGYGGTRKDAGQAVGQSGDGGIDGIIKEDRMGLDVVYIQAKRWNGVVGSPEIHKFVGALSGQHARKGVFLTTSSFTKDAQQYVSLIDSKVVLIDGETLAQLMIDFNVGVNVVATYEVKRLDRDYFVED